MKIVAYLLTGPSSQFLWRKYERMIRDEGDVIAFVGMVAERGYVEVMDISPSDDPRLVAMARQVASAAAFMDNSISSLEEAERIYQEGLLSRDAYGFVVCTVCARNMPAPPYFFTGDERICDECKKELRCNHETTEKLPRPLTTT